MTLQNVFWHEEGINTKVPTTTTTTTRAATCRVKRLKPDLVHIIMQEYNSIPIRIAYAKEYTSIQIPKIASRKQ